MHLFVLLATLFVPVIAFAPCTTDNPPKVEFHADLHSHIPQSAGLRGFLSASTAPDRRGVDVKLIVSGLPSRGPFTYHIHTDRVPPNGTCAATGDHFDPYHGRRCSWTTRASLCEVGDLSGKHGMLHGRQPRGGFARESGGGKEPDKNKNSTTGEDHNNDPGFSAAARYRDLYLSTRPDDPAFIGERAVVVRFAEDDIYPVACGTLEPVMWAADSKDMTPPGMGDEHEQQSVASGAVSMLRACRMLVAAFVAICLLL